MSSSSTFSVKEIANRYTVSTATVLAWIRSGELRAINVGRAPGRKKPRWRIAPEALASFELIRAADAPPEPRRRRRNKNQVPQRY